MLDYLEVDNFLTTELITLSERIRSMSMLGKNDFAIELENFMIPIFNIYFDDDFINLNTIESNYPAIDLYSNKSNKAIQITTNSSRLKKVETVQKANVIVESGKLDISNLYIFTMDTKNTKKMLDENIFFKNDNLINLNNIFNLDHSKKESIVNVLKRSYQNIYDSQFLKYKILVNRLFINTKVYENAKNKLENENIVIMNGNAGTGKTITSYKILFDYLEMGYISINNISEISNHTNHNLKYILFIDDFISPNDIINLDYDKINQAISNLDLASNNIKIVLNTRTHIINSYAETNSRFPINKIRKYFVSTEELTPVEKVEIIKVHLIDSYDSESLKDLFTEEASVEKIRKIIEHDKFNPRIIETFYRESREVNPKLVDHLIYALNNPNKIYFEQYSKLTDSEKTVLKFLSVKGSKVSYENIVQNNLKINSIELKSSLNSLDDSFILKSSLVNGDLSYDFYNPSIRDFVNETIKNDMEVSCYLTENSDHKIILRLLSNESIELERKIEVISKHPDKKLILEQAKNLNSELYLNFKEELTDIFIEKNEIPFSYKYRSNMSKLDIINIENKFEPSSYTYINYSGVTDRFSNLIVINSELLVDQLVIEKIFTDFFDTLYEVNKDEIISNIEECSSQVKL